MDKKSRAYRPHDWHRLCPLPFAHPTFNYNYPLMAILLKL